jgi:hypothetical protein
MNIWPNLKRIPLKFFTFGGIGPSAKGKFNFENKSLSFCTIAEP